MAQPLLSVVVATHLRPLLLARALQSLRDQTFQDFQIVLCSDEGSTETKTVASRHLRPEDVFVAAPGLKGPAESRNLGLTLAKGAYVVFLDDDDSFEATYFKIVAEQLRAAKASVLYCNYSRVTETRGTEGATPLEKQLRSVKDRPTKALWVRNFIPSNAFIVERNLATQARFDPRLRVFEDWDYLLSLMAIAEFVHFDAYGPCVHISKNPSEHRDYVTVLDGSAGLDILSMYRKWPSRDEETRSLRSEYLKKFGVQTNPAHL